MSTVTKATAKNIDANAWYLICAGDRIGVSRGPYLKQQDARRDIYHVRWPAMQNNPILFTVMKGSEVIAKKLPFARFYQQLTARQMVNATQRAIAAKIERMKTTAARKAS